MLTQGIRGDMANALKNPSPGMFDLAASLVLDLIFVTVSAFPSALSARRRSDIASSPER